MAPNLPPISEDAPDDLAVIHGIGPSMQERLNKGGILTYTQLARATVQRIEEILGAGARLADVEGWIERAQELVDIS